MHESSLFIFERSRIFDSIFILSEIICCTVWNIFFQQSESIKYLLLRSECTKHISLWKWDYETFLLVQWAYETYVSMMWEYEAVHCFSVRVRNIFNFFGKRGGTKQNLVLNFGKFGGCEAFCWSLFWGYETSEKMLGGGYETFRHWKFKTTQPAMQCKKWTTP